MEINPRNGVKPVSDFRKDAAKILKQLQKNRQPILLTQRGRSVAVLLDIKTFENLDYNKELKESYERGIEDIKKGRVHTHKEVIKEIRALMKE